MRSDVPSPAQLRGGRVWAEAVISAPDRGSVVLPIGGGSRVWKAGTWPSEQLAGVVVPRRRNGEDLLKSAVGTSGHRATIRMYAEAGARSWGWTVGSYLLTEVEPDGASLLLSAALPVQLVIEHKYPTARPVNRASTIPMIVSRLLTEDNVSFWRSPDLGTPVVPKGFTIGEDRGEALEELLDAWGAYAAASPYGGVGLYRMPTEHTPHPELVFREDPETGTVVDAPVNLERRHIYNHVTVRVKDEPRVASAMQTTGRFAVSRYGYRTLSIETDSISRYAEAQIMAQAELRKGLLQAVTIPVESVADWRVDPYDAARLYSSVNGAGRITGFDIPLTNADTAVYDIGLEV